MSWRSSPRRTQNRVMISLPCNRAPGSRRTAGRRAPPPRALLRCCRCRAKRVDSALSSCFWRRAAAIRVALLLPRVPSSPQPPLRSSPRQCRVHGAAVLHGTRAATWRRSHMRGSNKSRRRSTAPLPCLLPWLRGPRRRRWRTRTCPRRAGEIAPPRRPWRQLQRRRRSMSSPRNSSRRSRSSALLYHSRLVQQDRDTLCWRVPRGSGRCVCRGAPRAHFLGEACAGVCLEAGGTGTSRRWP